MMPISLYDIEQAELKLAVERKRATNPNEGPPDFHDGVRFGEAATLATVTPLVQQMREANSDLLSAVSARPSCQARVVDRCRCLECAIDRVLEAKKEADAFLSGATKESTDHG